jgi:adenosylcobinamide kinase/adenosylcobinamide-phosphate guanylyltransferase
MTILSVAKSELILGGQKSGKSRRAELLARQWLGQGADHRAVLIATAQPWDDEMRERIARHQADRAERVPGMATVEEPLALAQAIAQHSTPQTLLVVDCLTLWLTNCIMPVAGAPWLRRLLRPWTELDEGRAPSPCSRR